MSSLYQYRKDITHQLCRLAVANLMYRFDIDVTNMISEIYHFCNMFRLKRVVTGLNVNGFYWQNKLITNAPKAYLALVAGRHEFTTQWYLWILLHIHSVINVLCHIQLQSPAVASLQVRSMCWGTSRVIYRELFVSLELRYSCQRGRY